MNVVGQMEAMEQRLPKTAIKMSEIMYSIRGADSLLMESFF